MGEFLHFIASPSLSTLPMHHVENILFNVVHHGKSEKRMAASKKLTKSWGAKYTIVDSGGYEILTAYKLNANITHDPDRPIICTKKQLNITPQHVVAAGAAMNPDILIALDYPILKISDPVLQKIEFNRKIKINAKWAKETAELQMVQCPGVQLFLPIQCYTIAQFDVYLNCIGNVAYDGFCMPVRNLNSSEIILFLIRFYQLGVSKVHLLGTETYINFALSAYMSKHYFQWFSLDATSSKKYGFCGVYLHPDNLSAIRIGKKPALTDEIINKCRCPWCANRNLSYIANLPKTDQAVFFMCHNFWVTENVCKRLYEHTNNLISFNKYLMNISENKNKAKVQRLCDALMLADALKDNDIKTLQSVLPGRK